MCYTEFQGKEIKTSSFCPSHSTLSRSDVQVSTHTEDDTSSDSSLAFSSNFSSFQHSRRMPLPRYGIPAHHHSQLYQPHSSKHFYNITSDTSEDEENVERRTIDDVPSTWSTITPPMVNEPLEEHPLVRPIEASPPNILSKYHKGTSKKRHIPSLPIVPDPPHVLKKSLSTSKPQEALLNRFRPAGTKPPSLGTVYEHQRPSSASDIYEDSSVEERLTLLSVDDSSIQLSSGSATAYGSSGYGTSDTQYSKGSIKLKIKKPRFYNRPTQEKRKSQFFHPPTQERRKQYKSITLTLPSDESSTTCL